MNTPRRTVLELAAFAALAWYTAAHWTSGLIADAPAGRVFACLVIAALVAVALILSDAVRGVPGVSLRCGAVLAGLGAGFVAVGLDRRLLAPAHWDELGDGLDRGFAALGTVDWPYQGAEPWAELVLLLAVPLVLTIAAALAFWPRAGLRPFALVLLIALYGVAVTEHEFDGELGRGMVLLLLTAAWLWLPRLPERGWSAAGAAAGAVLVACVAALPAAARYDERDPLLDYQSWNPFETVAATSFEWNHSYGPIDWPRDGKTLMNVRSDDRNYWKVETLDRFDGTRWVRSRVGLRTNPLLPEPYREQWETQFRVTIRDLDTDLFPIAGTALRIEGADPVIVADDDGTISAVGESLDKGDSYEVEAYVPQPTPAQMRAAPTVPGEDLLPYVPEEIAPTTELSLPGEPLPVRPNGISVGARGQQGAILAREVLESPYARVWRLSRRLAAGQPTAYDVVRAVQSHLRTEYIYDERPPRRDYPLAAFLFRDRVGYCQQFSGAMALMLRMLGIPARVAAGFTPGSYNADTKEYRVRDLDAHSWVEVWFTGVGWVPFDPTPSIAPADSQSSANAPSASGESATAGEAPDARDPSGTAQASDPAGGSESGDSGVPTWVAVVALALLAAAVLLFARVRSWLRGRRERDEDPDVATLTRVLARTGEPVPPRLTLSQLESRLEQRGGPPAARYARMLRERRFGARGGQAPDAAARRDLRRALARGKGLRIRLAALAVLPPVSFRRD